MKSATTHSHVFALIAIVFTVMYSISFIWNVLLTDNIFSIAYSMQISNATVIIGGIFVYLLLSTLMVNIYLFAFANKRPIFNSVLYGVIFGFSIFLVASIAGIAPGNEAELTVNLGNAIRHITEQTIGALVLGYTLVQIR